MLYNTFSQWLFPSLRNNCNISFYYENIDPNQAILLPSSTCTYTNQTENYFLPADLSVQSGTQSEQPKTSENAKEVTGIH